MKIPILPTAVLLFALFGSVCAQTLPKDAQELLKKHQAAATRLNETLNGELGKVKARCMKDGDLEGANAVTALIKNSENLSANDASDSLVDTVWNFHGGDRQKLNEFTFLSGGKVKCDSYKNANWKRIDEVTVLFGYGNPGEFIIFKSTDASGRRMEGVHSINRMRYLERLK